MLEMLITNSVVDKTPGLKGVIYGRTQKSITGNGMKMTTDGKYLASGYATANAGTGEVYISDLRSLTAPAIKRIIRLPEWKPGTTAGTFSRAGQIVRGSNDLSVILTNTSADGIDKGAIYVMNLDADHNVTSSSKIYPTGAPSSDYFSQYVDMSGDGNFIVSSSIGYSSFIGRVYIYARSGNTWTIEKTIDRPPGNSCMRFGTPVSISDDGEFMAASAMPSATAKSSRVFLFKRNGGAWDLVSTVVDSRGMSTNGRISGYISGNGNKLVVAYSYNDTNPGVPEGGFDIYDINQSTGILTKTGEIAPGMPGGGYGISVFVNQDGTSILGTPCYPVGNQYNGLDCVQFDPDTGQYEYSWHFTTPAIDKYPVYPVTNKDTTVWGAAVPNLISVAQDSFFCGK